MIQPHPTCTAPASRVCSAHPCTRHCPPPTPPHALSTRTAVIQGCYMYQEGHEQGVDTGVAEQSQQQLQQQQAPQQQERIEYAMRMRQLFSPPGMLQEDGSIEQEFFRPKKVVTLADKKWGDAEREALYRGLEQYGVGKWRQMTDDMLRGWDDNNVRLKAAKLLGCQNLSRYYGRCLSRAAVDAELQANKQLGAQTGCWKNGMLVDDNKGTLAAHFRQQQQQQPGTDSV